MSKLLESTQKMLTFRVALKAALRWIKVLFMVAIPAACTTVPEPEPMEMPVFPPPPADPRFYFEHTINSTAQVKIRESRADRLRRIVTGESQSGIGFSKPFDVAVCKGTMFVSDSVLGAVLALDFVNGRFYTVGEEGQNAIGKPLGLNTDSDCNVFIADARLKKIGMFRQDGTFVRAFGGSGDFERLSHIAADDDRVYGVDTGGVESEHHSIVVFDKHSGSRLYEFGTRGKELGQLNLPRDIEVGPDGNLYVVDGANFRVHVFDREGVPLRTFGDIGRRSGQFVRPKGIAIDAEGNVYVTDASHGNFQIFSSMGDLLLFVGGRSERPRPAMYLLPAGIDIDEDGRVYMVGQYFRKVDVYRPAGLDTADGYLGALSASE